jgi:hypothetical protein
MVATPCRFAKVADAVIRSVELIVQPDASSGRLHLPLAANIAKLPEMVRKP